MNGVWTAKEEARVVVKKNNGYRPLVKFKYSVYYLHFMYWRHVLTLGLTLLALNSEQSCSASERWDCRFVPPYPQFCTM